MAESHLKLPLPEAGGQYSGVTLHQELLIVLQVGVLGGILSASQNPILLSAAVTPVHFLIVAFLVSLDHLPCIIYPSPRLRLCF